MRKISCAKAIALLDVAVEARNQGLRLVLVNDDGQATREIIGL